ncbi:MAG: hypothetical protein ABH951_00160 [Patescibacteria group bacterium]
MKKNIIIIIFIFVLLVVQVYFFMTDKDKEITTFESIKNKFSGTNSSK